MSSDAGELAARLAAVVAARDRALAEAELLNAMAVAAAGEDDLDRMLAAALELLGHQIPFTGGSIVLIEGDELVLRAAVGRFAATALGQRLPRGRGRLWSVIEAGEPFLSGDVVAEGLQPSTPFRSFLAVPLVWRGTPFGALEVDSTEADAFDAVDLALLQRAAVALSRSVQLVQRHVIEAAALAEAEQARRRFAFLAEASVLLAGSLDYETTLAQVTRLAVPALADWCMCDVVESTGALRRVAVACAGPDDQRLARALMRFAPFAGRMTGASEVVTTGESRLVPEVDDAFLASSRTAASHRRLLRRLGARSAMVVPIIARGRVLGALTFILTQAGRRYGPADLVLAEELARRAGLAADNALLYREAQAALAARDRALVYAEAERDRLQQVVEVLPEAVLIVGPDGRFVVTNDAARAALGSDVLGEVMPSNGEPSPTVSRLDGAEVRQRELPLQRAVLDAESVRGEQYLVRNHTDGRTIPVLANSEPLRDAAGALAGGMVVFQDISAIRDFEQARDDFLSTITHDLRTPLTAIQGFAQLLQRRAGREPADRPDWLDEGLAGIASSTAKMSGLVNELLDVGRLQMGRPLDLDRRPVDLVQLINEEAQLRQKTSQRHRIVVQTEVPHLVGLWDAYRLERVFANLLSNAIKYSPNGGEVTVRLERQETPAGAEAVLSVLDSGVGIPAADLPHVFERFYRGTNVAGRFEGMGIGLAGVQQIVEQHGGAVSVESTEGEGTIFTVRLPLHDTTGDLLLGETQT